MASKVKKNVSAVGVPRSTAQISGAVPVRLSKAHLNLLTPAVEQLVRSYREHLKNGSSRFSFPFRIFPPPEGFDRGVFNPSVMEKILSFAESLRTSKKNTRRIDTFQLRAAAFAIRAQIDFARTVKRFQRTFLRWKPKQRMNSSHIAQVRGKSQSLIRVLERHMKRANRALIKDVGTNRYAVLLSEWKAHLRWMRLHIAYHKPWSKPSHGRKKRQQRDLDQLMEMAKVAVRGEGHRAPVKIELRKLMRLYARYARSGRPGYWSVSSLLENKDTYRAQWSLAQFVIKRSNRRSC